MQYILGICQYVLYDLWWYWHHVTHDKLIHWLADSDSISKLTDNKLLNSS